MKDYFDTAMGYIAAGFVGFTAYIEETLSDINWMTVGAGLLLISRLAKDVPDGVASLIKIYKRMRGKYVSKD